MKDFFNVFEVDMFKDSPYLALLLGWLGSVDWLIVMSIAVAAFRGYVAYKEYKLKEEQHATRKNTDPE